MNGEDAAARFLTTRSDADFRALVEAWQQRVFRLVASVLGPYREADAEDITQEVFLQVYRKAGQLRDAASFAPWLFQTARHRAIDSRRRARFRLPHLAAHDAAGASEDPPERRIAVAQAIETLPETYRTLLYLYYWQRAPVAEIAGLTGLPPGTVKSYLARARDRVRAQLTATGVPSHE
jgi:RNA polymerase sigma-70 factor (ECF subfamily)